MNAAPSPARAAAPEIQGTGRAASEVQAVAVAAPPPPPPRSAEAPPPAQGKPGGILALAREQEAKGQKAVARDMYEEFVKRYPTDPGAAQAHFRLGDLAAGERRHQDAIVSFGRVAKDFPRSDEAPEALLRTADAMSAIGLADEAATVLAEVPKRYPSSPAASKARERLADHGARRK